MKKIFLAMSLAFFATAAMAQTTVTNNRTTVMNRAKTKVAVNKQAEQDATAAREAAARDAAVTNRTTTNATVQPSTRVHRQKSTNTAVSVQRPARNHGAEVSAAAHKRNAARKANRNHSNAVKLETTDTNGR